MTALPTIGFQRLTDTKNLRCFGRDTSESQAVFKEELRRNIELLYNTPSIALWTIFNEGWGQFNSNENYHYLKSLDSTRIIDSTSGWFDQGGPDLASKHIYFRKLRFKKDKRPLVLSEFGGYSCYIKTIPIRINNSDIKASTLEKFEKGFISLYENQVIPSIKKDFAAAIYTHFPM